MNRNESSRQKEPLARGWSRQKILAVLAIIGPPVLLYVWAGLLATGPVGLDLGDGRKVTIVGCTVGTRHRYVHGPVWAKPLGLFLPESWSRRFGLTVLRRQTPNHALLVWTFWEGEIGTPAPPAEASVGDLHGFETAPRRFEKTSYPDRFKAIQVWEFESYPPKSRPVRIKFYGRVGANLKRLGELNLRIPRRAIRKEFVPSVLPQTVAAKDIKVELLALQTHGPVSEDKKLPPYKFREPTATALLRLIQAGRETTAWEVAHIELESASGNHARVSEVESFVLANWIFCSFPSVFWPDEPAWKVRFHLIRTSGIPGNQDMRLGPLPSPAPGPPTWTQYGVTNDSAVVAINMLQRYPPGVALPWERHWDMTVGVVAEPRFPQRHLRIQDVRDEHGSSLAHRLTHRSSSGYHTFQLESRTNSATLWFDFALQESHRAEFLVTPARVLFKAGPD